VEAGETMCWEMAYEQGAYRCAALPLTVGSLRGG